MSRILLLCCVAMCIVIENTKSSVPNQPQKSIVVEMKINDTIYVGTINKKIWAQR